MPLDSTENPTTEVIVKALEFFQHHGWCQKAAAVGADKCLWGALRDASGAANGKLLRAACNRIVAANGIDAANANNNDLIDWNDKPGRTKEQVIEALERAL